MYLVAAERQGVDPGVLNGTLQTDIFKEYIAQKEWLFPPEPHLRLIGDLMEHCAEKIPAYKPLSVSGLPHPRGGSTAAQELGVHARRRLRPTSSSVSRAGLDDRCFAPGLSFFFDAHVDFFEEIAKFRAAAAIWARWLRDVYGAQTDKAQWLRFHTQTAGVSLTGAAALQQRRAHRHRGARRRARRHQQPPHQRPRRDARAAERAGRRDRAAHPAGDHGGDRRRSTSRTRWAGAGTSKR
jgi:methylmalonyl-CoA mutase cobalamin-binding domain/chain